MPKYMTLLDIFKINPALRANLKSNNVEIFIKQRQR